MAIPKKEIKMIYFILDKHNKAVRIGQTSKPYSSLRAFQVGNCRPLELLAVLDHRPREHDDPSIPPLTVEWFKAKFRKHKIRSNWFEEEPVRKWLLSNSAWHYVVADYDFRHLP